MTLTDKHLRTRGDFNEKIPMPQGFVVWLTGLPSSGKTTIAAALASALRKLGVTVEILDGDELRQSLSADLGFSPGDRHEQIRRVTYIAKLLSRHGIASIVPLISPYREDRQFSRSEPR